MEYINKFIQGNSKEKLKLLPDKSIRCCVTSPPYYGLRDYGTGKWEGGDSSCDHAGKPFRTKENVNQHSGTGNDLKNKEDLQPFKSICGKCGAIRIDDQIGLEETPEEFIASLIELFDIVKDKLTDDGTLWVNIGDSYATSGKNRTEEQAVASSTLGGGKTSQMQILKQKSKVTGDLKPKDLIGIPWMLAFALRAAGWYLRQDIIWHKPNPMPESVTDRCTKSHEYIFLLSKSKQYYYDAESISTTYADKTLTTFGCEVKGYGDGSGLIFAENRANTMSERKPKDWTKNKKRARGHERPHNGFNDKWDSMSVEEQRAGGANKRSVWTVATKPYKEAHFATFPPELIIDCIKAGSTEGDIVLDPFSGAGTTAMVAAKLNRNFIAIELNQKYIDIANKRLDKELGLFRK